MDSHGGPRTRGREPQPERGSGVKGRLPGWQVWRSHWGGCLWTGDTTAPGNKARSSGPTLGPQLGAST